MTRQIDSFSLNLLPKRETFHKKCHGNQLEKTMKEKCLDSNLRNTYVTQEYIVEKSVPGFLCSQIFGQLT